MNRKHAVIYLCKGRPSRSGGGLGVAYNYLSATWGKPMEPADADHILICGEAEVMLGKNNESLDEFLSALDTGARHGAALFAWQASRVRALGRKYDKIVVLSFSPFYLWPLVRVFNGDHILLVHSEHSKGGRHYELAEERGKFGWRERFVRWCVGLNFCYPDRVVFPSRGALNLFTGMNPRLKKLAENKAAILYNGVEVSAAPAARTGSAPIKIVSVAHHVREKGLNTLLESLRMAAESGSDWTFTNYGQKSDLTEELVAQVSTAGLSSRVEFAGLKPQAEVRAHLATGDLFLHTPTIVVFDLSLLEAMMQAIPVVTVPLEGNREALGEDYPLYASTSEEVVERLRWIADHREDAYRIGLDLRERALRLFTNEAMVGHYSSLFRSLLE